MKKAHTKGQGKAKLKLAFLALGILVTLILLAKIYGFFASLSQPFDANLGIKKSYSWNGSSAINIVLKNTSKDFPSPNRSTVSILNFQPKENKIIILHMSDQIHANLPKGYGSWTIGSIYDLGQEENPAIGAPLLKMSLAKLLGLPIEGIIILDSNKTPEEILSALRSNKLYAAVLSANLKTDLTPLELTKFIWAASAIRSDKVTTLDLAKSTITESKLLPDSSRVLGVDGVKLDIFVRDNMSDSIIVEEGKSVAVFNATNHPGLAQDAARTLTNLGANVVIVSNTESAQSKTKVILGVGEEEDGYKNPALKRIAEIFAPDCLDNKCYTDDPKVQNSRAQINIVLGEDYYNYWYSR